MGRFGNAFECIGMLFRLLNATKCSKIHVHDVYTFDKNKQEICSNTSTFN
jgi:hypothetical protein